MTRVLACGERPLDPIAGQEGLHLLLPQRDLQNHIVDPGQLLNLELRVGEGDLVDGVMVGITLFVRFDGKGGDAHGFEKAPDRGVAAIAVEDPLAVEGFSSDVDCSAWCCGCCCCCCCCGGGHVVSLIRLILTNYRCCGEMRDDLFHYQTVGRYRTGYRYGMLCSFWDATGIFTAHTTTRPVCNGNLTINNGNKRSIPLNNCIILQKSTSRNNTLCIKKIDTKSKLTNY